MKLKDSTENFHIFQVYDILSIKYTETKKFSNTLQIRIFITEVQVDITQIE